MPTVAAYGLVTKSREPVPPARVEEMVTALAAVLFPGAAVVVDEAVDRGSLVSDRPERFRFVHITVNGESLALCRFRPFETGVEFVFNASLAAWSSREVDRHLSAWLPIEIVRRVLL